MSSDEAVICISRLESRVALVTTVLILWTHPNEGTTINHMGKGHRRMIGYNKVLRERLIEYPGTVAKVPQGCKSSPNGRCALPRKREITA